MDKIMEVKGVYSTEYHRFKNEEVQPYKIVSVLGMKQVIDGFNYFLILDSYGKSIKEAFFYLNLELGNASYKKRELAYTALKLLYSFNELFNIYDIPQMSKKEIKALITFLGGGDFRGINLATEGLTVRSNTTINKYIGVYRAYFEFLDITPNYFMESKKILARKGDTGFLAHSQKIEVKKYVTTHKGKKITEVPSYISFEQYKKIIDLVSEEYTLREQIICRLMYEYGLRIGEVLGLTLEDFVDDSITKEQELYKLILRNRLTDKPHQYAKGCMKVNSKNDYLISEYKKMNFGYQEVVVTDSMGILIQDYIDNTRSPFSLTEITSRNLTQKNIADKVGEREDIEQNQYIFISKNYTPITSTAWNLIIKEIFLRVGIEIDKGKKKQSLNHRFRHGFAMFKILNEGYDQLRLSKVMRHNDTNSINYYFKPTEEDRKRFAEDTERLLKNGGINLSE